MAITFQVTDGTLTVSLSDQSDASLAWIVDYVPQRGDGEVVSETARIAFKDSSVANVLATIRNLEILLARARAWEENQLGAAVYIKLQLSASETLMRSPLKTEERSDSCGVVEYDKQALHIGIIDARFEVTLSFTRADYWEADSETELALLNGSVGGKATGGITVYNHDDADANHDNYVEIAGADVGGVADAACRILMTNSYNNAAKDTKIIIGHNAYKGTDWPVPVLEGEDASGTITPTVDAQSSAGSFGAFTTAESTEQAAYGWSLPAATLNKLAGHRYRVFMRGGLTSIYAHVHVLYGSTVLAETAEVLGTSDDMNDLGEIELPPYLPGHTDFLALSLTLNLRKSGGFTCLCDALFFVPTTSYRELRAVGAGLPYQGRVIDDGVLDELYCDSITDTDQIGLFVANGDPIRLVPGRDQRLVFLFQNDSNDWVIAHTATIQVYYRPRRLTL